MQQNIQGKKSVLQLLSNIFYSKQYNLLQVNIFHFSAPLFIAERKKKRCKTGTVMALVLGRKSISQNTLPVKQTAKKSSAPCINKYVQSHFILRQLFSTLNVLTASAIS